MDTFNKLNKLDCIYKQFAVHLVIVIIIAIYGLLIINGVVKDRLLNSLFGKNRFLITGWSVTHFIWFTLIGYLFPNCMFEAMMFGLMWELIEIGMNVFNTDTYYYGCYEDILFNFIGFIFGRWLNNKFTNTNSDHDE